MHLFAEYRMAPR